MDEPLAVHSVRPAVSLPSSLCVELNQMNDIYHSCFSRRLQ